MKKKKAKIPVWVSILSIILLSLVLVSGGIWLWASIAKQRYKNANNGKITPTEQLSIEKDTLDAAIKIMQTMGAFGFFFTAYVSWKSLQNAEKSLQSSEDKQITERFSKAVELLSESNKLEARIGGIYLLERIAKDYPADHPTVIEVLTAYVRDKSPIQSDDVNGDNKEPEKVTADIQAALTVIGMREVANDRVALNLNGADISGANLSGANLSGANLSGINLASADLSGANLEHANLSGANLSSAILFDVKLNKANLVDAILEGAILEGADLKGANLTNADLRNVFVMWFDANLSGAILRNADLEGAKISNSNLSGTILGEADLSGASLLNTNLSGANLSYADLLDTDLSHANLRSAILRNTDLRGAILRNADLHGAILKDADLSGADLRKTKNLLPEQIQLANAWQLAEYDSEERTKLGLDNVTNSDITSKT